MSVLMTQQTFVAGPTAFKNLIDDFKTIERVNNSSKPTSEKVKPSGQTSGGQSIDKFGNKIGPSGKPQINTVQKSSRKAAKDAARNAGKGSPVLHNNPVKGNSHFHPTDGKGKKIPNSTHFEF